MKDICVDFVEKINSPDHFNHIIVVTDLQKIGRRWKKLKMIINLHLLR